MMEDFVVKENPSCYDISTPETDMRVDCSVHEFFREKPITSPLFLRLTGEAGGQREVINQVKVNPRTSKVVYDFSYVMKRPVEHRDLRLEIQSYKEMMMINFEFNEQNVQEI